MYGLLELGTAPGQPDNIVSLPVSSSVLATTYRSSPTPTPARAIVRPGELVDYLIRPSRANGAKSNQLPHHGYHPCRYGLCTGPGQAAQAPAQSAWTLRPPAASWSGTAGRCHSAAPCPEYKRPWYLLFSSACKTPFGGDVHLEDFGIRLAPAVEGDRRTWAIDAFYGGTDPYSFFGGQIQPHFTDDAVSLVIGSGLSSQQRCQCTHSLAGAALQCVPVPSRNFKVVYDETAGTGVRIAGAGNGALTPPLEDDGPQSAASKRCRRQHRRRGNRRGGAVDPSGPRSSLLMTAPRTSPSTVTGLETPWSRTGAANHEPVGADGHLICDHWTADELVLTYTTQVDGNAPLDTQLDTFVTSSLDRPGD